MGTIHCHDDGAREPKDAPPGNDMGEYLRGLRCCRKLTVIVSVGCEGLTELRSASSSSALSLVVREQPRLPKNHVSALESSHGIHIVHRAYSIKDFLQTLL